MRRILTAAVAAITAAAVLLGTTVPSQAATLDSFEADLVTQVNSFRASKGLSQVRVSDTLTFSAKWMATDMAVNNYFSHTSLDGRSPQQRMADAGYPASATWTGENLAAGYTSAREVVNGWVNSPGHYAVLTNPNYLAIGVGRAYGAASQYGNYWAANFGGIVDAARTAAAMDIGFHAAFSRQSADPVLSPGQVTTLVVAFRNTGYRGWYQTPGQQAYIGTASPLDVPRTDLAYGWVNASRPATQTTYYVGPGQEGWFQFQIVAPRTPGVYRLAVRPLIEGTTWLEDAGVYWTITVR